MQDKRELEAALRFDGIHEAEKVTGKSYKDGPQNLAENETLALGFAAVAANNQRKNALLRELGDTTMSDTLERYMEITDKVGFETVLTVPFEDKWGKDDRLIIRFEPSRGILLVFDTWEGRKVNGGKFYYNVRFHESKLGMLNRAISSGSCTAVDEDGNRIWCGDHDCREALVHHIQGLEGLGGFVTPWEASPYLSLLTRVEYEPYSDMPYEEWKAYRNDIHAKRFAELPLDVRKAIKLEM